MKKWIFKPIDRNTPDFFPACVDDYLPEHHDARFVVEIVDQMNLSAFVNAYRGTGSTAWHPSLMLSLLFHGYSTGVFSSRQLEKATYDSIAFRFICANEHPDHDSINAFRKRFQKEISALFVQILLIAKESSFLKMGTISLDGTKVKANASKHKALSYKHACKLEKQLTAEVDELLKQANEADLRTLPEDVSISDEIKRREDRLAVIASAKAEIERRAAERDEKNQAEYQQKMARREALKAENKRPRGPEPKVPETGPKDKDQVNLTDDESRIMPTSDGGFMQAYNAQAAVDIDSGLIVEAHLTQATNDKQQIAPALDVLQAQEAILGKADKLLADTGYFSAANVNLLAEHGITPYIAEKRDAHNKDLFERFKDDAPEPESGASALEKMRWSLNTKEGREIYGQRKSTIEPTFGIIKEVMGYRQFLVRGLDRVSAEWDLVCIGFNLKRLITLMMAAALKMTILSRFIWPYEGFLVMFQILASCLFCKRRRS